MSEHSIFYYPYADFKNEQLPLLKVAALYFDKLYILDPHKASYAPNSVTLEIDGTVENNLRLLADPSISILKYISPAEVLGKYEQEIAKAVRADMEDEAFQSLCRASWQAARWELALEKVTKELQQDMAMQRLMGELPRAVADPQTWYLEAEAPYDFRRGGYPLALGESIMLNHALFGGLLYTGSTPLTDNRFHSQVLALKMRRAMKIPAVREVYEDLVRQRQLKADLLVASALTDSQLKLPVLNPKMPLEEVLEYRAKYADALQEARDKLGWMARRIEAEPWSDEFASELEHKTIPDIADELKEVRKARDSYLKSRRRRALVGGGVVVSAATVLLTVFAAPITPVALVIAGLSLYTGVAIPGAEWLLNRSDDKKTMQENGLHYLLMYK
jgi:hypothetical protein